MSDRVHIMPVDDLREHTCIDCWCNPTPSEDDEDVILHHSMDQRELYETGERKPS